MEEKHFQNVTHLVTNTPNGCLTYFLTYPDKTKWGQIQFAHFVPYHNKQHLVWMSIWVWVSEYKYVSMSMWVWLWVNKYEGV